MLYSYEWLQQYIEEDLPDSDEILSTLTKRSVEVEEIIEGGNLDGVVVGEVLKTWKHPNADSLHVGLFDVGEEEPRQIVFGMKAGLPDGSRLPVALAPCELPGGWKIKKSKLRGEVSMGMCCLNSEIGILDRAEKVNFFGDDVAPGTPIGDVVPTGERLIDIDNKSMTNRADLFSHVNMAREIAAVFGLTFTYPELQALPEVSEELNVTIEDKEACTRYMGMELEVTVGPSPDWIQRRLQAAGVKVINNVVDITNYVMMELGEPMHAFDVESVAGKQIVVRRAKKDEVIYTLDKDTKKLNESILVIADVEKPLAIAGVIGGMESGVTTETTRIILEAACFEPLQVRRAGAAVGVRTDSLLRWEKGLSPEFASRGMQRAVELLMEHADAKPVVFADVYPEAPKAVQIALPVEMLQRLTGIEIPTETVVELLERLECTVEAKDDVFEVQVPWFRSDLNIAQDLVEEVVRLYGVENIPEQPLTGVLSVPPHDPELVMADKVRDDLVQLGASEVMLYSFYGADLMKQAGADVLLDQHVEIANPLSADLRYVRPTLFPRMINQLSVDLRYRDALTIFEVGHLYYADRELRQLGVMHAGGTQNVREMRGMIEQMLYSLNAEYTVTAGTADDLDTPFWAPWYGGQVLRFEHKGELIGVLGEVQPLVAGAFNIEKPVAYASFSIAGIVSVCNELQPVAPLSPYPAIPLDFSIIVDEAITWEQIEQVIEKEANDLLESITVFDVYRGDEIPDGKKSIAFHLVMQSQTKTLEMEAMEKWRDNKMMPALQKQVGAQLRGKSE